MEQQQIGLTVITWNRIPSASRVANFYRADLSNGEKYRVGIIHDGRVVVENYADASAVTDQRVISAVNQFVDSSLELDA